MKILFDSYNTVTQNDFGGVSIKIKTILNYVSDFAQVKLYDKWNDKISDYDIFHAFMPTIDHYSIINFAKKQGLKIVVSAILNSTQRYRIYYSRLLKQLFCLHNATSMRKNIFDIADVIICETEKERKFIVRNYSIDRDKIRVIANGVDEKRKDVSEEYFRTKTGIKDKFILQVGRFDTNKNQLSVIRALKNTNITAVFIGGSDKNHKDYYEKCVKEAGKNIYFLGWVNHNDPLLYSAYAAAQAFVMPSYNEIFGNAMFEAGLYGCNIVATKVLPLDTWGIDKYCQTINPKDINDIRNKIEIAYNLAKNPALSNMIESNFLWRNAIEKHYDVYNELLNKEKFNCENNSCKYC